MPRVEKSPCSCRTLRESVSEDTGRCPTLPTINTIPAQRPATGPIMVVDSELSPTSSSNPFHDAVEHQASEIEVYPPFNTMEVLCQEEGLGYPLERWTSPSSFETRDLHWTCNGHIDNILIGTADLGLYTTNPGSVYNASMEEIREPTQTRWRRRASSAVSAVSDVGRGIRRTSGSLRRSLSNVLGLTSAQDVVKVGERKEFIGEEDVGDVPRLRDRWTEGVKRDFANVVW